MAAVIRSQVQRKHFVWNLTAKGTHCKHSCPPRNRDAETKEKKEILFCCFRDSWYSLAAIDEQSHLGDCYYLVFLVKSHCSAAVTFGLRWFWEMIPAPSPPPLPSPRCFSTVCDDCSEVHLKTKTNNDNNKPQLISLHRHAAKFVVFDLSIPTDDRLKTLKVKRSSAKQLNYN